MRRLALAVLLALFLVQPAAATDPCAWRAAPVCGETVAFVVTVDAGYRVASVAPATIDEKRLDAARCYVERWEETSIAAHVARAKQRQTPAPFELDYRVSASCEGRGFYDF